MHEGLAAHVLRRLKICFRRLVRLFERGRGVWRPLLATLLLALLFASPLIWADHRHHFQGSRRAGYRFLCASSIPVIMNRV